VSAKKGALPAGKVYISAIMSSEIADTGVTPDPAELTQPFDRVLFWRVIAGGVALLTLGAGLLWLRFGSLIFFDMLSALQGCF
jgi:hypothetical protein